MTETKDSVVFRQQGGLLHTLPGMHYVVEPGYKKIYRLVTVETGYEKNYRPVRPGYD